MKTSITTTRKDSGQIVTLWAHSSCEWSPDTCGIDADSSPRVIDDFDLAVTSFQANSNLSACHLLLAAGTYRYVRLDIRGAEGVSDTSTPNLSFGVDASSLS